MKDCLINFSLEELLSAKPYLHHYAVKLVTSQNADDLLQQVYLLAIEKQHLFNPGTNLKSWLMSIMHNKYVSNCKAAAVRFAITMQVGEEVKDQYPDQQAQPELNVLIRDVTAALAKIPKKQLEVISCISFQGMSYQECADKLNVPIGTVRSRLTRARASLSHHLN